MKKLLKISLGIMLSLMLSISAPMMGIASVPEIAMAATSEPSTTVSKVTIYVGYKTYQIKFENLSKSADVTFKSSNVKVAKVNDTGIITPISKGKATVTVTMKQNKKSYTSKIQVTVENSNIKFTTKTSELSVGDVFTFKAKANGTNSKISWSVSDTSIAKIISTSGKLTALEEGEVDVIASAGGISSRITLTVTGNKFTTETKDLTIYEQKIIYIQAADMASNEDIIFDIGDSNVLNCQWGDWEGDEVALLLDPVDEGTTTVTITSSETNDKLVINVIVVDEPDSRPADAKELSAKEIYSKCAPATVELQVTKSDGDYIGSGFFLYSGILITNYHVVEGATKITVVTYNNKEYEVDSILGYDESYDIAVLTINAVTDHLSLNKGDVTVGETVYALGSPRGLSGSLSNGIVSSASRVMDGVEYIQVTAPISGGNSGGPLLNAYGEVIGINTFIIQDSQNLNFALNVFQYLKLNYNTPIKAADFYEKNKEEAKSKTLVEDESKSSSMSTAQYVNSDTIVQGSFSYSDTIDGYHFTFNQSGEISGIFMTEYKSDMDKMYFGIYDKNQNEVYEAQSYTDDDGSIYLYMNTKLSAGDYWIIVYSDDDYIDRTINYQFYLEY